MSLSVTKIDRPRAMVLVVEDDPIQRASVAEELTAVGYRILQAANADQAMLILEKHDEVRVVYTDVEMPGSMDGLRLAHYIAQRWPPIRLLVSSGREVRKADLPVGASFCAKPCAPDMMLATISELLA